MGLDLGTLQTPKATIEVKDFSIDISKNGGTSSNLFVKLQILPIFVHLGEPRVSYEQSSNLSSGGSAVNSSFSTMEKSSAPFSCEEFSLYSEFGHDRYFLLIFSFVLILLLRTFWSLSG